MQRGFDDNVEPDRSDTGPDILDLDRRHHPGDRRTEPADEVDPLRVGPDDSDVDSLSHPDRSAGLIQTDDIVVDDGDELAADEPDVLQPIPEGEGG